jgi:hypothetical protein
MVLRVAGLFAAYLLLLACHRHPAPRDLSENVPDAQQQALALAAVESFRASFNAGSCHPVYDQGAPDFHSQNAENWVRDCQRLRQQLGSWQRFQVRSAQRYGKAVIAVLIVASADFERQATEVRINVVLLGSKAYLSTFSVRDSQQRWTDLPPLPLPYAPRWADPPLPKSPRNGLAL